MSARLYGALLALVVSLGSVGEARADTDALGFAIVVGNNSGGPGQENLRFAERDALRVAEVLGELSRVSSDRLHTVVGGGRGALLTAIDSVATEIGIHAERDEPTRLFFYYSGHARASALNLGDDQVGLDELRDRLAAIPATVTVAVLDACQSGAFSRVKGASPTADFSYNTVAQLNTQGMAVMASSTGSELSQESEDLQASFFTHHLLVALRGGADADADGRVTLGEAYRYAYNHTLVDTAVTAVGGQHVTLETELRGKGELALSFPAEADAQLDLPPALAGKVLVYREPAGAIVAEVQKAATLPMRLGLPAGHYVVVFGGGEQPQRCPLELRPGEPTLLAIDACQEVRVSAATAKGDGPGLSWEETFNYVEQRKHPMLAAVLALQPLPGGVGHIYADRWWTRGAFFTLLEFAELVALARIVMWKGAEPDYLMTNYGVTQARSSSWDLEPGKTTAIAGLGLLYLVTKVWESYDAYATTLEHNRTLAAGLATDP